MVMGGSILCLLVITVACCHVTLGNQLAVLNVPPGVKLAEIKQVSLLDVQALPYQLFGLDETQSRLLADVSFFRRPSLLAIITVTCGNACPLVKPAAISTLQLMESGSDALMFQPFSASSAGVSEAMSAARLDKSVVADTGSLADSTNPTLFAGLHGAGAGGQLLPALANEVGLPAPLVGELRLAQAAVHRLVASGLLADSQPDALHIGISAGSTSDPAVQARVAAFVADIAAQLTAAAGPDRAFVAVATVSEAPSVPLVRVGRSLMAATDDKSKTAAAAASTGVNLAPDYNADFPIMFNLILWLSVVLVLAVYAVAYGLWNIDPGKDSIIYRRGYAHAKKD